MTRNKVSCSLLFFSAVVLTSVSSFANSQTDIGAGIASKDDFFALDWLDQTQAFASNSANSITNQIDSFFGAGGGDLDAAYSSLRLTWINSWDKIEGAEVDLRLRGKLHLPRINERISLIFSEDEHDDLSGNLQNDIVSKEKENTKVDLGFTLRENARQRINFRAGLNSSLKARLSLRYRYDLPMAGNFLNRFSQIIYFKDGRGFGAVSQYQLDMKVSESSLLRWSNDIRVDERKLGVYWHTELSFFHKQSEQTGLTYYYRVGGETKPNFTSVRELGVRMRRNILRPWLFVELEPGYLQQKTELNSKRESSPFIHVRFEMAVGHF